jgi:hypothetical protein
MRKIRGNVIGTPIKPEKSIIKATDLTEEQKAQARANIGAVDAAYVDGEIAAFDIIKVVDALPETGLPNRFYLVPKANAETQDLFDEFVWVNGAWEYITTKQIEIDLTDYVKNTDYATTSKGGVIRIGSGLQISSSTGQVSVYASSETYIDGKSTNSRVITPGNLDYAVKAGICGNSIVLTEEEKAAARAWLGIE